MGGLPFFALPGLPGFGPSLPKIGGAPSPGSLPDFGAMFDQLGAQHQGASNSSGAGIPAMPSVPSISGIRSMPSVPGLDAPASVGAPSVSNVLPQLGQPIGDFLESVNGLQLRADSLKQELASGGNVELHDVMIAEEKAGLAVELTMQLRNKLVDAYQEIMRMQV